MKKRNHYLLSFLIPIFLFALAMFLRHLYPFGNYSLRISDALNQYPAFFEGLKQMKLFTFNIGLGMNFYHILTTYLMSPLNIIYFFFKKENFDLFFAILILIKIGLMGLTMNLFLNYQKKETKSSLIFSTIYALSGFTTLYHFNYQFLDAVYMLPIIMLGLKKLIKEEKDILYYFSLTLAIIFNYYTGYIICLFSLIYFFFILYNKNLPYEKEKKIIKNFLITSILSGFTASFILIPTAFSFMQGRNGYFDILKIFNINIDGLLCLYRLAPLSSIRLDYSNYSLPIYTSLFIVVSTILTIINKNGNKRLKKSLLVVTGIYLLSMIFYPFYLTWHVFQLPVGNPGRFVFCFSFFYISLAYQTYTENQKLKVLRKSKIIAFISIILIIMGCLILKNYPSISQTQKITILFTIFLIFVYFQLYKTKKYAFLLYIIIFIEILANTVWDLNINQSYNGYSPVLVNQEKEKIKNLSQFAEKINEEEFSRSEILYGQNESMFYNLNGVSFYSSIFNNNINQFMPLYNINNDDNYAHYYCYQPALLMDAFLGIKRVINYEKRYIPVSRENDYYVKSLGFAVSNNLKEKLKNKISSIEETLFDLTNILIEPKEGSPKITLTNVKNSDYNYEKIDKSKEGKIKLVYSFDESVVARINFLRGQFSTDSNNQKIYFSDIVKTSVEEKEKESITILKNNQLQVEITLPIGLDYVTKQLGQLTYVNQESFIKILNYLNENRLYNIKVNRLGFTGQITTTDEKNLLLLTIPYDDSIIIKVDGQKQPYEKYFNGIIGLELEKGDHQVEFIYQVKGLNLGILISILSFLTFILKKKKER